MAQMFCTLKQAADKLDTTEAQIEAMLNDGVLREFRDGSSRLLKVADLAGLAVTGDSATGPKRSTRARRKAESTRPAPAPLDTDIKLPPAPVATAEFDRPARQARTSRAAACRTAASPGRRNPPRAVVISPTPAAQRLKPPEYQMSVREWIWMGLIEDNPVAIFIVFGTVILGVCALAGAGYLLVQAL